MSIKTKAEWEKISSDLSFRSEAFINGKFVKSHSHKTFDCINPSNGKLLTKVASCDDVDVDLAVKSCRNAFDNGHWSRMSPTERKKILLKLFDLFRKKGGKFKKINVKSIEFNDQQPILKSETEKFSFNRVVIACGAFSKKLTDNLDEKIPLDTERGYHVHFKNCDHLLQRPVISSNRGFGITPMEQGLRVVGTVEFGGLKNPLSKSRIKNLINNAKYMLGDLPDHEDEWLGFRPTLPDFLPVMGPSKNHKNVFYCFGHHHLGWTLGPISGKIVSGMIAKENTNLNLAPYSSTRFN
mgnify:CR=1 FL=1